MSDTYEFAHCWRNGEIEFSVKPDLDGAIVVDEGPSQVVRARMMNVARHGHEEGVLLVPGIPEADDDEAAETALHTFLDLVEHRRRFPHG